ncbi:glycosyltransferase family 2 protein [Psychrobacter sp. 4Dc]|uniref:glycosyltransferase family 2 protein n=1 Tax=Psychrobacter sp. 4Dc TaxID=888437 RepID=UPI000CADC18C|nr:glycosyltransferase family 2 protein [Psychrobacter sp. 4Dc]PKH64290.1 glycosyltransferase family 2 protein [Psychrobacter sp. 4Dc]
MSKANRFVSIGIPFYNNEDYLTFAIQSVINQSHQDWELILINDGSSDSSLEIAQYFVSIDSRVRVISDGLNKKLPARLNQLIDESKYKYIARMDADDIMHPERLEKQLSFLETNKCYDLVSTGLVSIDNNNKVKGYRKVGSLYDDFSSIRTSYPIVHPSVMGRRSWFERNRYSEEYPRAEDFELWTRAISKSDFKMAVLPELLLYYREEGNINKRKMIESYNDLLKIYKKYNLKEYLLKIKIKMKAKIFIVNILYHLGQLQKLADRRNLKFKNREDLLVHQGFLDRLVKKVR